MKIKQLQYVIEVAREKSITKAAQNLYTTQSNISYYIKLLEDELGYEIFVRSNNGTQLTPYGEKFYVKACEIVHLVDGLHLIGKENNEEHLRVSSFPISFINKTFTEIVEEKSKENSQFELLQKHTIKEIIDDVLMQEVDIGIIGFKESETYDICKLLKQNNLKIYHVIKDDIYIYISKYNSLIPENKTEITFEELSDMTEVIVRKDQYLEDKGNVFVPKNMIYIEDVHMLLDIIKRTNAFYMGTYTRYRNENADKEIRRVKLIDTDEQIIMAYILRKDDKLNNLGTLYFEMLMRNLNL